MVKLHPTVVHFAIALFLLAVFCDVLARLTRKESLQCVARWNLYFAALAGAASVGTGFLAEAWVAYDEAGGVLLETHELVGCLAVGLMIFLAAWRLARGGRTPRRARVLYLLLSFAAVALVSITGYLGGELVYSHGVGVEPMVEILGDGLERIYP